MKNKRFKLLLKQIHNFNNLQFRQLQEEIRKRIEKKKVSHILETEKYKLHCPFCNERNYILWGKRNDLQRYKCKSCLKTFNSLTNTPLARLKRKGHWLKYASCLRDGLTLKKSSEICEIHINTAFRWRHRFLTNMRSIKAKKIGGIIESGYSKLKESFKGTAKEEQTPIKLRKDIFIIYNIDRNNNIFDITNKQLNLQYVATQIQQARIQNSLNISEDSTFFNNIVNINKHHNICLSQDKSKINFPLRIYSYRNRFEDWIYKHFRGVATKYLENYVSWYRCLNEFKSGINALTILYRAKSIEKYRHQPEKVKRFI
ncbi:MAG: hypothetical protein N4A49_05165 [Marinifilaceae bacterium]|jgi:transposase-like protein|nr:hypothetical protein [Marinifilaceae bacterium]